MNNINIKISKQAKDIIQKYTSGLFRNATLEFYGVETAKIKELINGELQNIEVAETSTDFIFLLEDDTYLHFEFQTTYNKDDLLRFAMYDLRLYERDKRKIQTVVIYSADVRKADENLSVGSLVYTPANVMMYEYDGNAIYADLQSKLKAKQDLTDLDILNLIFLPLMKNDIPKNELAKESIKLAQTIPSRNKRDACIASAVAFMNKYLNNNEINNLLEVLKMTDIFTRLLTDALTVKYSTMVKKLTENGLSLDDIAEVMDLDIETIKELQEQEDAESEE